MKFFVAVCLIAVGLCSQVKAQAELFMGEEVKVSNAFMEVYEQPDFVFVSTNAQEFEGPPTIEYHRPSPVQKPAPQPQVKAPKQAPLACAPVQVQHHQVYTYRQAPNQSRWVERRAERRSNRGAGGKLSAPIRFVKGLLGGC